MQARMVVESLLMSLVNFVNALLLPCFYLSHGPWTKRRRAPRQSVLHQTAQGDGTLVTTTPYPDLDKVIQRTTVSLWQKTVRPEGDEYTVNTLDRFFGEAVKTYKDRPCMGTRPRLSLVDNKYILGDSYRWQSYRDVFLRVQKVSQGLVRVCGVRKGDRVVIFAETQDRWMITALACFNCSATVATIVPNSDESSLTHCLAMSEAKVVFVAQSLLPKLTKVMMMTPTSSRMPQVVCFEDPLQDPTRAAMAKASSSFQVLTFGELEASAVEDDDDYPWGWTSRVEGQKATTEDDCAIIMFTSGSTGNPKGTVMKHGTVMASVREAAVGGHQIMGHGAYGGEAGEVMVAFLPLSHIFELQLELAAFARGTPIGYSSPYTLMDSSPMVAEGQVGDLRVLRPTLMITVPLVLERIHAGIRSKVQKYGQNFVQLFEVLYEYKKKWAGRGYDTPFVDKFFFHKYFRPALGGNLVCVLSGGAPLNTNVHQFIHTVLGVETVVQGFGMTETCGGIFLPDASCCRYGVQSLLGHVGGPIFQGQAKLVSWPEGGYPEVSGGEPAVGGQHGGEIHVGGPFVADGYLGLDKKDCEAFYADENGTKWIRTEDIAVLTMNKGPRGCPEPGMFQIVDRRNNMVKSQNGEFVALVKVEGLIQVEPLVDMVMVHMDPSRRFPVALVVPNREQLLLVRDRLSLPEPLTWEDLCAHPQVVDSVLDSLTSALKTRLNAYEIPRGLHLVPEPWTPDSGLVTATMKVRRQMVQKKYRVVIDSIYSNLLTSKNF